METAARPGALLRSMRAILRRQHYSVRTEEAYVRWVVAFVRFHKLAHPANLGPPQVRAFLDQLAVGRHLSASSQNQALNALLFLYRQVLGLELGELGSVERARRPKRFRWFWAAPRCGG